MLGTTSAWYYTNYLSMVSIPSMILWPIFLLLSPIISWLNAEWKTKEILKIKHIFQKYFLTFWISFTSFMFVFAIPITTALFWEKYSQSGAILQYSILFLTWNFLLHFNYIILSSSWKAKQRLKIVCNAIIINFLMNYFLISFIWVYWAAIATGIWWIIIWLWTEYFLKDFRISFDVKYILKNLFFLWCLWILCFYFVLPILVDLHRWVLFLYLLIIGIIYFWAFSLFNKDWLLLFEKEIFKLKNKNT